MYYQEIIDMMELPVERATQAMFTLLRQGLTNGACIPEVETEAEQAAHHMLGCDNYRALIVLYATVEDMRRDDDARASAQIVNDITDEHLMLLTKAIIAARGPIGEHTCIQTTAREA